MVGWSTDWSNTPPLWHTRQVARGAAESDHLRVGDRRGSSPQGGTSPRSGCRRWTKRSDEVGTSVPAPACGASATRPTSGVGG